MNKNGVSYWWPVKTLAMTKVEWRREEWKRVERRRVEWRRVEWRRADWSGRGQSRGGHFPLL